MIANDCTKHILSAESRLLDLSCEEEEYNIQSK